MNTEPLVAGEANLELQAAVVDSFAQIAGWLAGIAAAGIIVYLTRQPAAMPQDEEAIGRIGPGPGQRLSSSALERQPVGSRHVVRTLFFAMSGLAICSFLYASAVDDAVTPGRLAVEIMFYSAALGTSVLALFYGVALMMLEHKVTRDAALSASWVLVVVGPAVVIRFVAGGAYEAWRMNSPSETSWSSPLPWGSAYAVSLALGSLWVVSRGMPTRPLRWLRDRLRARPATPAVAAFVCTTVGMVLSGVTFPTSSEFQPHPSLSWFALILGIVVVTYFAFACVSVLEERIGGRRILPTWR
jgi:sulfite exporter TauE/SafE